MHDWVRTGIPLLKGTAQAPIEFVQRSGDLLFVPDKWLHAVINTKPSLALSIQLGINKVRASSCSLGAWVGIANADHSGHRWLQACWLCVWVFP